MRRETFKFITKFFFSLIVIHLPNLATAQTLAGNVVFATGEFTAQSGGATRKLVRGSPVYESDSLHTSLNTVAEIRFTDGTLLALRPASQITVNHYNFSPKTASTNTGYQYAVNLAEGGLRTVTGKIAKLQPDSYKVTTAIATIGVRGTDLSVAIDNKDKSTNAKINRGVLEIANEIARRELKSATGPRFAKVLSRTGPIQVSNVAPAVFQDDLVMATPVACTNQPSQPTPQTPTTTAGTPPTPQTPTITESTPPSPPAPTPGVIAPPPGEQTPPSGETPPSKHPKHEPTPKAAVPPEGPTPPAEETPPGKHLEHKPTPKAAVPPEGPTPPAEESPPGKHLEHKPTPKAAVPPEGPTPTPTEETPPGKHLKHKPTPKAEVPPQGPTPTPTEETPPGKHLKHEPTPKAEVPPEGPTPTPTEETPPGKHLKHKPTPKAAVPPEGPTPTPTEETPPGKHLKHKPTPKAEVPPQGPTPTPVEETPPGKHLKHKPTPKAEVPPEGPTPTPTEETPPGKHLKHKPATKVAVPPQKETPPTKETPVTHKQVAHPKTPEVVRPPEHVPVPKETPVPYPNVEHPKVPEGVAKRREEPAPAASPEPTPATRKEIERRKRLEHKPTSTVIVPPAEHQPATKKVVTPNLIEAVVPPEAPATKGSAKRYGKTPTAAQRAHRREEVARRREEIARRNGEVPPRMTAFTELPPEIIRNNPPAPVPPSPTPVSGFQVAIGIKGCHTKSHNKFVTTLPGIASARPQVFSTGKSDSSNFATASFGYMQNIRRVVLGAEVSAEASRQNVVSTPMNHGQPNAQLSTRVASGSAVDAIIGVRATPRVLGYVKGGYASMRIINHYMNIQGNTQVFSTKDTVPGKEVGAGVEYAFSKHLGVRAEFDRRHLRKTTDSNTVPLSSSATTAFRSQANTYQPVINSISAGIVVHF